MLSAAVDIIQKQDVRWFFSKGFMNFCLSEAIVGSPLFVRILR
ncbi:unnamed protein product [Schistosoma mattheei]|uniref:Uncharacterized protein n=1 Tax=Schistosoma mattheei TaxID=31246 RepID=A0A183NQ70_9TREM|nr:unnamed protein product [Schistosoma mattheei]